VVTEEPHKGIVPVEEEGDGSRRDGDPTETATPVEQRSREELLELFLRARADLENARRRFRMQSEGARADAHAALLREMLPVLDSFDRALEEPGAAPAFQEGMERIHRQLLDAMERFGLEEIEAEGAPFDPDLHEAVEVESAGDREAGEVVAVIQKGYTAGGRLLRPARVRVTGAG
jgi:molecular chaperone GrpE